MFPYVFDNKVLAFQSQYFGKNELDSVFSKCQKDVRLRPMFSIDFDKSHAFAKYEGSSVESKHHEAAFDAYMTGYCIPFILKFKEYVPQQSEKQVPQSNSDTQEKKRNFGKLHRKKSNPNQKKDVEEEKVFGQD